jgi:hypothetical protein
MLTSAASCGGCSTVRWFGSRNHRKPVRLIDSRPVPIGVFAGQAVGIKEVEEGIWLVSFMEYDLGYIDLEGKTLQPLDNPFGPKV